MKITISKKPSLKTKNTLALSFFYNDSLGDFKKGMEFFEIINKYGFIQDQYRIPSYKKELFNFDKLNYFLTERWIPFNKYNPYKKEYFVTLNWIELYRGKIPKYWGGVTRYGGENAKFHSNIYFYVESDGLSKMNYLENCNNLILSLVNYANVDFARVQYYSNQEMTESEYGNEPKVTLVADQLSEECLPDLYNITIWGKPYIEFFRRERLLNAPCYKVEELSSELIWMQLSPDVYNAKGCWTAIRDIRERVKAHLDNNAFYDPTLHTRYLNIRELESGPELHQKFLTGELMKESYRKNYKVPQFDLSDIRKPLKIPEKVDK